MGSAATSSAAPTRRERQRQATYDEIVEVSRRLLRASEDVSLRAVSAEMGMTPPALYRYVDSHAELMVLVARSVFEDVVAAFNPVPADDTATAPHWSVTFGSDDADATAERAVSLGGEVVVPPFDGPFVRMTVLRDPQGATFTASQFVPENRDLAS